MAAAGLGDAPAPPQPSAVSLTHYPIVILGSGPAGYSAAVYTGRAMISHCLLRGPTPGGQSASTGLVENYLGLSLDGADMADKFEEHVKHFGTELLWDSARSVNLSAHPFQIVTSLGKRLSADALIIATGANARHLGLADEARLTGHGVSSCATCDGYLYRGKAVCVVGGGDSACMAALHLANLCTRVYLVHRQSVFRASRIMAHRVRTHPLIELVLDSTVNKYLGSAELDGVRVRHTTSGETRDLAVAAAFPAIGHDPATELFHGQLDLDGDGYIQVVPGSSRTSVPGVFACGDCQDKVYRQIVTSAGTGCMAALDAEHWLGTLPSLAARTDPEAGPHRLPEDAPPTVTE